MNCYYWSIAPIITIFIFIFSLFLIGKGKNLKGSNSNMIFLQLERVTIGAINVMIGACSNQLEFGTIGAFSNSNTFQ